LRYSEQIQKERLEKFLVDHIEFADAVEALSAQKKAAVADQHKAHTEQRRAKQDAKRTHRVAEHEDEFPELA
jgi:hypothetical protein